MTNIFTKHPSSVGETYYVHMKKALCFSWQMFFNAAACTVHAFLPFLFQDNASNVIAKMTVRFSSDQRGDDFNAKIEAYKNKKSGSC